jgi:hypothetical protein
VLSGVASNPANAPILELREPGEDILLALQRRLQVRQIAGDDRPALLGSHLQQFLVDGLFPSEDLYERRYSRARSCRRH